MPLAYQSATMRAMKWLIENPDVLAVIVIGGFVAALWWQVGSDDDGN